MKVSRGHRFELKPNNAQRTLFARCAGTARFAWNWALAERQRLYREREGRERFNNAIEQHRVRVRAAHVDPDPHQTSSPCRVPRGFIPEP